MFRHVHHHRGAHYLLLTAVCLALYLPNLGVSSLWDIDEGNNVEAFREMLAAGNWHVPTFNFQLRVDKPALLYWLQIFCSYLFGVGELAGRLPSALASVLTVLTTYELGRKAFGSRTGLLAGLVLASSVLFCAAAHFANPDALLTACTTLAFFVFWSGLKRSGQVWFVPVSALLGLAVLAKGPVGLVLPGAVFGLYLLRAGRFRQLFSERAVLGVFVFVTVALPWYLWVGVDTKFAFVRDFIGVHNVGRALRPMEGHGGPFYYYLVVLTLGLAPWSVFFLPAAWLAYQDRKRLRGPEARGAASTTVAAAPTGRGQGRWFRGAVHVAGIVIERTRTRVARCVDLCLIPSSADRADHARAFLWCWITIYLAAFTIVRTKLPNYVLPIYPAVALLTGNALERWRRGAVELPGWLLRLSLACFGVLGLGTAVGFLAASGAVEFSVLRGRRFPGLAGWAALGLIPVLTALVAGWLRRRQRRSALIVSFAVATILFLVPLAGWGSLEVDSCKAPRGLARVIHDNQEEREVRIAAYEYFQPSLVFYCRREVGKLNSDVEVREFLRTPWQVFLVTPASTWDRLAAEGEPSSRLLGHRWDLYRGCEIVVVTNRTPACEPAAGRQTRTQDLRAGR